MEFDQNDPNAAAAQAPPNVAPDAAAAQAPQNAAVNVEYDAAVITAIRDVPGYDYDKTGMERLYAESNIVLTELLRQFPTRAEEIRANGILLQRYREDLNRAIGNVTNDAEYENLRQRAELVREAVERLKPEYYQNQVEADGQENREVVLRTAEGGDNVNVQVAALEGGEIPEIDNSITIPTFADLKDTYNRLDANFRAENIFTSTATPRQMRPTVGNDVDNTTMAYEDEFQTIDNTAARALQNPVLRPRPPGRYGRPNNVQITNDMLPQLSYGGQNAKLPKFNPLYTDPKFSPMLAAELTKIQACPMNYQDCIFDHSISTPFACTGTNYPKLQCIPFCNQHLLSIFGIGLEYGEQIAMDKACVRKSVKFGPFAIAKSYDKRDRIAFRKYECIYPAIVNKTTALGGALSALFSRREDLSSLHLSRNILNVFYYVLDSSDVTIKDICKPYHLLEKGNCDAGVFDVLATMIAFLIWCNSSTKVEALSLAPYVNNLEFILTVAKKLIHLNYISAECLQKTQYKPIDIFRLKLFDYETTNHGLPPMHPTTIYRKSGIVATRDICQDERLTCKFNPDVMDDVYFKFKNPAEYNKKLKNRKDRFVPPPTNSLSISERKDRDSGFRISKHTLSDVADNCLGDYGHMAGLSTVPLMPLAPIILPKPNPLPQKRKYNTPVENLNDQVTQLQTKLMDSIVDKSLKNRISGLLKQGLQQSAQNANIIKAYTDLSEQTEDAAAKTQLDNLLKQISSPGAFVTLASTNPVFYTGGFNQGLTYTPNNATIEITVPGNQNAAGANQPAMDTEDNANMNEEGEEEDQRRVRQRTE